jgi:peptidoglycan/xylan/chitin deacetylase (PgdA/CDA1 family)
MLREMSLNNIDIGSQTCSHQILSHLSEKEQLHEIAESKAILEREIGKEIISFAYPVGGIEAFTNITAKIVYNHKLLAPITKGKTYGDVRIILKGKMIAHTPLIALKNNPKGGFWSRSIDRIQMLFSKS